MLSKGLGDGSQIQIANEYGQEKYKQINYTLNNSFLLQFIISTLLIGILFIINNYFLGSIVSNTAIEKDMKSFLDYRTWGLFFAGFQASIMAFFIGIGKTRIIITSSLLLAFTNIVLDYGLIFGHFGLPKMGIAGAGLASTISEALTFVFLISFLFQSGSLRLFDFKLAKQIITHKTKLLLKLSAPLMLGGFLSISTWFVFFSFIEQRNAFDLEVSHIVRNLFFISFIPIFGFASTTRTYVAYFYGKRDFQNIKSAQNILLVLSIVFYLLFFHGALLYPKFMVSLISDDPIVIEKSASILKIVFGSMLLYAIITVYYNSVAAIGKTLHTLLIEFISISIYLMMSYYIIVEWKWDIHDVWYIEYLYFGVIGLLSIIYLYYFNHKQNKIANV